MAIIDSGYVLLSVVKGSTSINLDPLFPGAGTVYSDGVPIDPERLGNFSTGFIRRGQLPDGESGAIPIEFFAEHSLSTQPVKLTPFGLGDGVGDYHSIINLGGAFPNLPNTDGRVRPSIGVMGIRRTFPSGGRFDLLLNINPLIVITKVGGSVLDLNGPDILRVIDASGLLNPVSSIGGQWTEETPKLKAFSHPQFQQNNFLAALDRTSQEPISVDLTSGGASAVRQVQAARFL